MAVELGLGKLGLVCGIFGVADQQVKDCRVFWLGLGFIFIMEPKIK
jgi:hypothetical protein